MSARPMPARPGHANAMPAGPAEEVPPVDAGVAVDAAVSLGRLARFAAGARAAITDRQTTALGPLPALVIGGLCLLVAALAAALAAAHSTPLSAVLVSGASTVALGSALLVRTMVLRSERARAIIAEREADLSAVHAAGLRLTETLTADELYRTIARAARELTGAAQGLLVVNSPDGSRVAFTAASVRGGIETVTPGDALAATRDENPAGLALSSGRTVRVAPGALPPSPPPAWYPRAASYLAVPLVIDGHPRGELVAAAKTRGRAFTEVCQLLLSIYASEASAALKGALLGEAMSEALHAVDTERSRSGAATVRSGAVLEIAERLTRTLDRGEILGTIATELNRVLRADGSTVRVLDGNDLRLVAWTGISDDVAARLPRLTRGEGWFGQVSELGRPIVRDDVTRDPRHADLYGPYDGILDIASDMVVPLVVEGEVVGALSSFTTGPRQWTDEDVAFASAVATHAAIAIHNAGLFADTEARASELAVIADASARMNRENTVESVGRALVEETRRIIEYHNMRVYLVEAPDQLVPIAFEGTIGAYDEIGPELLRTTVGTGFTGWVAQHGEPLLVNDANADPRGSTIIGTKDVDESMLVVPVRYDARVTGVITLSKLGLDQFRTSDLRLLTILADQAATALESARLLGRSQRLAEELRQLLEMSTALARTLDPREVADLIARHLARALDVDEVAISHWDRASERVITWGYYPPTPARGLEDYELAEFPETRRVMVEQVTVVTDVDDGAADPAEVDFLRREGMSIGVMLPLVAKGESIGLVELLFRTSTRLGESEIDLARAMANEAAMALENARLYETARSLADRDPLTGFYNHRYLHERLGEEIVRSQRSRRPVSVVMLDVDDFKLVNDTFGHLFGDRVLGWTAEVIRSTLRLSDVPARYGGDEFAVILPDTDGPSATAAVRRICDAFTALMFESESRGPLPIGISVGVATFPSDARTGPDLIAAADAALYRMKAESKRRTGEAGRPPADPTDVPEVPTAG